MLTVSTTAGSGCVDINHLLSGSSNLSRRFKLSKNGFSVTVFRQDISISVLLPTPTAREQK